MTRYVTVPVEPSEAMLRAMYENRFPPNSTPAGGFTRWATWEEARVVEIEPLTKGYRAMLAASPQPVVGDREAELARLIAEGDVRYVNENDVPTSAEDNRAWAGFIARHVLASLASRPEGDQELSALRPQGAFVPACDGDGAVVALRKWVLDYEADVLEEDMILVDDGLREFPLKLVKALVSGKEKS